MKLTTDILVNIANRIALDNEFLDDMAGEYELYNHSLFIKLFRCEDSASILKKFIEENEKNGTKIQKNIIKHLRKEEKKAQEAEYIKEKVEEGYSLSQLAKENYKSRSSYPKLMASLGYKLNKELGIYTHEDLPEIEGFKRLMNGMDLEEMNEILFNKRYYDIFTYDELYEHEDKMDTTILNKQMLQELNDIAENVYNLDMVEDLIHYIILKYLDENHHKDLSREHDLRGLEEEGFITKEELEIKLSKLKKQN